MATPVQAGQSFPDPKSLACHVGSALCLSPHSHLVSSQQASSILFSTPGLPSLGRKILRWEQQAQLPQGLQPLLPLPRTRQHLVDGCPPLSSGARLGSLGPFFWAHLPGSSDNLSVHYPAGTSPSCFGSKHWCGGGCLHGEDGQRGTLVKKAEFFSRHQTRAELGFLLNPCGQKPVRDGND